MSLTAHTTRRKACLLLLVKSALARIEMAMDERTKRTRSGNRRKKRETKLGGCFARRMSGRGGASRRVSTRPRTRETQIETSARRSPSVKPNQRLAMSCLIRGSSIKRAASVTASATTRITTCTISRSSRTGPLPASTRTSGEKLGRAPSPIN